MTQRTKKDNRHQENRRIQKRVKKSTFSQKVEKSSGAAKKMLRGGGINNRGGKNIGAHAWGPNFLNYFLREKKFELEKPTHPNEYSPVVWLRASIENVTVDASVNVVTWRSSDTGSEVGHTASQGNSDNRPDINVLNDHTVISTIDTDGGWLIIDNHSELNLNEDGSTWFAVIASGMPEHISSEYIATKFEWELHMSAGVPQLRTNGGSSIADSGVEINDGNFHIVEAWHDDIKNEMGIRVDGGEAVISSGVSWSAITQDVGILAFDDGVGNMTSGSMAEFIMYPKFIGQDKMEEVRKWFSAEYGNIPLGS